MAAERTHPRHGVVRERSAEIDIRAAMLYAYGFQFSPAVF
jgi:hypothetical protein